MRNTVILLLLLVTTSVSAQITLKGTVSDEYGNPLPYVNVFLQKTSYGTTTDDDGKFFLKTKKFRGTLEVSFVGFETQVLKVNKKLRYCYHPLITKIFYLQYHY